MNKGYVLSVYKKVAISMSLFLKHNDTIEIIAPASKFNPEILPKISELIQSWNLKAKISCPMSDSDWLCSTKDKERFNILRNALEDPNIKAIWVAFGGYGSSHLIPYLDKLAPPTHPKLLMGFSDATILHIFLNQKWNWPSLHCSSASQTALSKISKQSIVALKELIFENQKPYSLDISPMNNYCLQDIDNLTVSVVGGNLVLVLSSLGTTCQINAQDKFLFLEETSEAAYRIDRMFHQLLQAKVFNRIKGLIFGEFIQKQTKTMNDQTKRVLKEWAFKLPIPVFSCKVGHGVSNYPIPFNCEAKLKIYPRPHLKFLM